ncbi:MAG: hypothetical protein WCC74_00475 [Minisyncoccia bacterium]
MKDRLKKKWGIARLCLFLFAFVVVVLIATYLDFGNKSNGSGWIGIGLLLAVIIITLSIKTITKWVRQVSKRKDDGNSDKKSSLPSKISICWAFIKSVFPHIFWGLLIVWIASEMFSCARSCNEPKVQVPQTAEEARQATLGDWKGSWKEPVTGSVGSHQIVESGNFTVRIRENSSNQWDVVISDNQGRRSNVRWKKGEPVGKWVQEVPQQGGEIWWERVSDREFQGWMTILYPEMYKKKFFISFQR